MHPPPHSTCALNVRHTINKRSCWASAPSTLACTSAPSPHSCAFSCLCYSCCDAAGARPARVLPGQPRAAPWGSAAGRKRAAAVVSDAIASSRKRRERVRLSPMLNCGSASSWTSSAWPGGAPRAQRHRHLVRLVVLSCAVYGVTRAASHQSCFAGWRTACLQRRGGSWAQTCLGFLGNCRLAGLPPWAPAPLSSLHVLLAHCLRAPTCFPENCHVYLIPIMVNARGGARSGISQAPGACGPRAFVR